MKPIFCKELECNKDCNNCQHFSRERLLKVLDVITVDYVNGGSGFAIWSSETGAYADIDFGSVITLLKLHPELIEKAGLEWKH